MNNGVPGVTARVPASFEAKVPVVGYWIPKVSPANWPVKVAPEVSRVAKVVPL